MLTARSHGRQLPGKLVGPWTNCSRAANDYSSTDQDIHPECDYDATDKDTLRYMPVKVGKIHISAMLDTGCNINIISKLFYESVAGHNKSKINEQEAQTVTVANNSKVTCLGTAILSVRFAQGKESLKVYILQATSHPLILGTPFLNSKAAVLNFGDNTVVFKRFKVRISKPTTLPPHSESITTVRIPWSIPIGTLGICTDLNSNGDKGYLISKSVDHVSVNHTVSLKLLNLTAKPLHLNRKLGIATFQTLGDDSIITPMFTSESTVIANAVNGDQNKEEYDKFSEYFDLSNDHLNPDQNEQLKNILFEYKDIFVTDENNDIGRTNLVEHKIHLKENAILKHQRPYRLTPDKKIVLRDQLLELQRQGVITPVNEDEDIPITSPIVLVSKPKSNSPHKPGSKEANLAQWRFCCDFRLLNSQTKDFHYNVPDLQELVESFSDRTPHFITTLDLSRGFFQIKMSHDSSKLSAFNTCFGTYRFLRLPMGLKTSPSTMQLLMDKVLKGLTFRSCLSYLDDLICMSDTFDAHMTDIREIFDRLRDAGLKIGPRKCQFAKQKCVFLGHEISKDGIHPPKDRLEKIENLPPPKTAKQLRRVIGLFSWFRKFIPNFSALSFPMQRLLKQDTPFVWGEQQQSAFESIKSALLNSEVLSFPRYDKDIPFRLSVDSSCLGIGYMLYQIYPEDEFPPGTPEKERIRVVRFGSKGLSKWQRSYGPTKLELLGVVTGILDNVGYLRGKHFHVECDHQALKPLFQKKMRGKIYERWLGILQQFNFDIHYKPAAEMTVPDALSRCKGIFDQPNLSPDEEDLFFPYVSENTGNIQLPSGEKLADLLQSNSAQITVNIGNEATDNVYDGDTEEIYEEVTHERKCKRNRKTLTRVHQVTDNSNQNLTDTDSGDATIAHPETSRPTDSTLSSSVSTSDTGVNDSTEAKVESLHLFTSGQGTRENFATIQKADSTLRPIIEYLQNSTLPKSNREARRIILTSGDYMLVDDILLHTRIAKSKRTRDLGHYQIALPQIMEKSIIQLFHDSALSGHGGIGDTVDRLKEHYYFDKLSVKVSEYIKSCHHCQSRKMTKAHTKSTIVSYPTPTGKFQVWQIDLFGELPITPSGHRYVFTAVDMFSKYLFCLPMQNKDTLSTAEALIQLISLFGCPQTLMSDNGTEFNSKVMTHVCETLHIPQEFSPSFVHHCLGACERTHGTLADRLTPFMKDHNWLQVLAPIVFSINNSVSNSLGYSPHEIVFLERPAFPLSPVSSPNLSSIPNDMHSYVKNFHSRMEKIKKDVVEHALKAKVKMTDRANANTNCLCLKVDDYVYLLAERKGTGQKLKPRYTGPLVVDAVLSPHLVTLKDPTTNKPLTRPVHLDRLKMAYVRCPNPAPYLLDNVHTSLRKVVAHTLDAVPAESSQSDTQTVRKATSKTSKNTPIRRSSRVSKKPNRLGIQSTIGHSSLSSDSDGYHKIKRVLGLRKVGKSTEYLIQVQGEPAQNAFWAPFNNLDKKTQIKVIAYPPIVAHE